MATCAPGTRLSAAIFAFSAAERLRRPVGPSITSSRLTRLAFETSNWTSILPSAIILLPRWSEVSFAPSGHAPHEGMSEALTGIWTLTPRLCVRCPQIVTAPQGADERWQQVAGVPPRSPWADDPLLPLAPLDIVIGRSVPHAAGALIPLDAPRIRVIRVAKRSSSVQKPAPKLTADFVSATSCRQIRRRCLNRPRVVPTHL